MSTYNGGDIIIRPIRYGGKSSFSAWKLKVLAYLQPMGLKDIVVKAEDEYEEDEPPRVSSKSSGISTSGSNKDTVVNGISRKQKSEKAYGILLNLLEDELIDLVAHVEAGDAHGVWTVLLETYETKSTASLCHTLDKLMNMKLENRESFDVYKARFMNLVLSLKEMGETVSPAIQRYVILKGLPENYLPLVQSLKINDKLSLEETCTH